MKIKSKIFTLAVVSLLIAVIVFISGCVQREPTGEKSESPARVAGPLIFTNQTVTTQVDAENIFLTWKQDMWHSQNTVGKPIFEAMTVSPFTGPFASGSGGPFTCNFGTIKFVAELPYVGINEAWEIENGKVLIRGCKSNMAVPVDQNQTAVCSSEDTVWIDAPTFKFWLNDLGVIFAEGIACSPFEIQWAESPVYTTVGKEMNMTFILKSKMDVSNYNLSLSLPPELELISVPAWGGQLKAGETIELLWRIKGLETGNYEVRLKGPFLNAVVEIRVEREPMGIGVPTE